MAGRSLTSHPKPGLEATLGQLLDYDVAVEVTCPACRHVAALSPQPLAQRYGFRRNVRTLRFRCRSCGGEGVPSGILPIAATLPATAPVPEALVA